MDKKRQEDLILAMKVLGFEIDRRKLAKDELYFSGKGQIMRPQSWELLEEWLNVKYYNSEITKRRVEFILYPERFIRNMDDT